MTNIFRKIFGLGPSKPSNVRPRQKTASIKSIDTPEQGLNINQVLPSLVSANTTFFNMENQLASNFHDRDGIFAPVFTTYVLLDEINLDEDGEPKLLHVQTHDKDEAFFDILAENGEQNLDKKEVNFKFWNPDEEILPYKIISPNISFFASESILSKKHMLKAHKMLQSDKLMVSIARKGLLFICDHSIAEEHKANFLQFHGYLVYENKYDLELLSEDIFIVENGEISTTLEINQLSDLLRNK